jgi:hypothetical protein
MDDDKIKQSVANVSSSFAGKYSLKFPSNNCQDFVKSVVGDYLERAIDRELNGG